MTLKILNEIIEDLNIPVETGEFSEVENAPEQYVVLTPISDDFDIFSDNKPHAEINVVRLSLFSKINYVKSKNEITKQLLNNDITITFKGLVGVDEYGYYNYVIDIERMEEYKWQQSD